MLANPAPEQTQLFCQTETWRTFCLERQVAAWVDNFTSSLKQNLILQLVVLLKQKLSQAQTLKHTPL